MVYIVHLTLLCSMDKTAWFNIWTEFWFSELEKSKKLKP